MPGMMLTQTAAATIKVMMTIAEGIIFCSSNDRQVPKFRFQTACKKLRPVSFKDCHTVIVLGYL